MRNRRCLFGTWVTLEGNRDSISIKHDDFDIDIMLVGKEVIPGIDHLFLIENNEHPLCVESENSKKFQDELDRSVHYVVTSTSKEGTHKSDHPIHGYESMAQKISYFIKKRPKKTRGKKITNSFQSKIIEEWYREKALVSCHKMIKKPLIKMASNLNFLTTALYRKIKSNLGRDKLEDYFSNMIMLRFHCDEFRSDNDFINDYFQYNAVSHILNDSYLDEDSKVLWCSSEYDNFGNPSVTREVDWRSVIAPDVNMCPNKRYIIDNLPRSIPSHVVSFMRSVSFEQELKDVQHILFKSYLQRQVEENINSLLDSSVFDFDDLKKSLKLYNDFRHQFVNTFNNKKRKKHSPRKSMVIKSFCVDLGKSLFVSQPQSIVDSGFCFSSLLEITKSLCIERMDSYLKSNDQRIEKRKRIIKMRDKFLKDNPDAIDTFEVFGVNSFEFPPF